MSPLQTEVICLAFVYQSCTCLTGPPFQKLRTVLSSHSIKGIISILKESIASTLNSNCTRSYYFNSFQTCFKCLFFFLMIIKANQTLSQNIILFKVIWGSAVGLKIAQHLQRLWYPRSFMEEWMDVLRNLQNIKKPRFTRTGHQPQSVLQSQDLVLIVTTLASTSN